MKLLRKLALSAALLGLAASTVAADYFVVVPVKGRTSSAVTPSDPSASIQVTLNSYSLPSGWVGVQYSGFDLKDVLQVTGDLAYNGTGVTWSVVSGSLPSGLSIGADGVISGTPTAESTSAFTVQASYKSKSGAQQYEIATVQLVVTLANTTLPSAEAGLPYTFDLRPLVSTNDPQFLAGNVSFSMSGLPSGLAVSGNQLTGTPSEAWTGTLTLDASYKGVTATKSYPFAVLSEADPYWAHVTAFASFEGASGSPFTETVGTAPDTRSTTFTLANGASVANDGKFGSYSLYVGTGAYGQLSGSHTAFGTRDFTIEYYFKRPATGSSSMPLEGRPSTGNGRYITNGVNGSGQLIWTVNGTEHIVTPAGTIKVNTWQHIAYSRINGVGRLFVDGQLMGSWNDTTSYLSNGYLRFGWHAWSVGTSKHFMDGFRITDGVGRYVTSFTPPANSYPTR